MYRFKMNVLPKSVSYTPKCLPNLWNCVISHRTHSTKVAVNEKMDYIKEFENIARVPKKAVKRKPQKPPFVKNFLLGVFDTDMLAYPEVFSKEEIVELEKHVGDLKILTAELRDKSVVEQIEAYKRHRLGGLGVPQMLGGRELSVAEMCQFTEALSENSSYLSMIHNDRLGIQTIYNKGSAEQKAKYLPNLISGMGISALCISEASSCDPRHLNTRAVQSGDNKWIINGQKDWIVNGGTADTMIVFAQTEALNKVGLREDKISAFIVERDFGGITSNTCTPIGLEGASLSTVMFNNTPVPNENVLGTINDGEDIASSFLTEFRLLTGPICTTLTKNVINKFIDYCKSDQGDIFLNETEIVRSKISKIIVQLYAMESMTYLTASLLDQYENQDCELEAAIVKVFSSEQCFKTSMDILEFLGTPAYMTDHWCNVLARDALSQVVLNETNDSLKIIIALLGLQYAGGQINEKIKKLRNPFFNPSYTFQRMWTHRKQVEDNPKLNLNLKHYLHPSLMRSSELLEYCVLRLQFATETIFARYGPDVLNKHVELNRLAASLIDTYAMAACLSRASRSYCTGLQNSEFETTIANTFCFEAMGRVKSNIKNLCDGPYISNDESQTKIAQQAFHSGKYFAEHPMARVF